MRDAMSLAGCKYMAGGVFEALRTRRKLACLCGQVVLIPGLFVALLSVSASAEELPDPTRPTAFVGADGKIATDNPPKLQSIIISKTRRAAIIDGKTVELRGKHGDAVLIEVGESGVVLQGLQGRQVLTLFSNVKIMQKEIQILPRLSVDEVGLVQKIKSEARKERK